MVDFLSFAHFFLINAVLFLNGVIFSLHLKKYEIRDVLKLFLAATVFYFSEIIVLEILLGVLELLTYRNICIVGYVLFLFSAGLIWKNRKKIKIIPEEKKGSSISAFSFFALFTPLIFLLCVRAFNALLQVPLEYDNVAYHLPFVVEWLQTGSLLKLYYSAFASPISYYPSNFELIDLWVMMPWHNDLLVNHLNFPLFVVMGLTIYKISRNFRMNKKVALMLVAWFFFMPVILRQAGVPLVDLFFILTFALGIYFIQEIRKIKSAPEMKDEPVTLEISAFALSLGLFIGTKYLGVIYAPFLVVVLLYVLYRFRKSDLPRSKHIFLKECMWLFGGMFVTGSFFYLRNWIEAGNPFFPADIALGSWTIFEGYQGMNDRLVTTSLLGNVTSLETLKEFVYKFFLMTGWQGLAIFAALLGLLIFGISKFLSSRKSERSDILSAFILLGGTLIYFYLYFRSPYSYRDLIPNVRYAFPFLLLGILSVGFLVSRWKFLRPLFYFGSFAFFTFSLVFLVIIPPQSIMDNDRFFLDFRIILSYLPLFFLFVLCIGLFFLLSWVIISQKISVKNKAIFAFVLGVFSFYLLFEVINKTAVEREKLVEYFYMAWYAKDPKLQGLMDSAVWLNEHAKGENVAYSGFNFHYHLFGRNLGRKVDYVNINDCLECRYVDFKRAPNSIRTNPDYESWFSNLKQKRKKYLVVQPTLMQEVRSYEFEWAKEHPEAFREVFQSKGTHVFEIQ